MNIKSKFVELFYLGCVMTEAIEKIENVLRKGLEKNKGVNYDARIEFLFAVKNRWIKRAMQK